MNRFSCPSCGSGLEVDDRFALFVVCESCDSTVVVDAGAARIHGKMGALAPPAGVLYLGAEGSLRGMRFRVLGRVRYGYGRGYWNEWLLSLDNGLSTWVSEDEDELELETLADAAGLGFTFDGLSPGDRIVVMGEGYHVDEKDVAVCEGGEGMLPFPIVHGEKVPYVELTGGAGFATLEFGPTGTRLFRGSRLDPSELVLDRSRSEAGVGPDVVTQAQAGGGAAERVVLGQGGQKNITCGSCGAPFEVKGADTLAATCEYCGVLVDTSSEKGQVLLALSGKKRPGVPVRVGMKGRLLERDFEVIGHMRLVERDSWGSYSSHEFLLRDGAGKDAWLVLEDGHYSLKEELHQRPSIDPRRMEEEDCFQFDGRQWEVDDVSEGASETIDWVEGEFTWVPKVGDTTSYMEAESPPFTLIAEWSATEMEWYRARYVTPAEVAAAFGIQTDYMPRPSGPKAGAPSGVQYPPARAQGKVALGLSLACCLASAASTSLSQVAAQLDFEARELMPVQHRETAAAEEKAAREAWDARVRLEKVRVEVKQALQLEKRISSPPSHLTTDKVRELAAMARRIADRELLKALQVADMTATATSSTLPSGATTFPIQRVESLTQEYLRRAPTLAGELPVVPEEIPRDWPAKEIVFSVGRAQGGCIAQIVVPISGSWVHLEFEVVPDGGEEVLHRFSRTFLSERAWAMADDHEEAFVVPAPGRYRLRVRGATGNRGSDRLAYPRIPTTVSVVVLRAYRSGDGGIYGSVFFFLWFLLELAFRALQLIGYSARVLSEGVKGALS